MRVPLTGGAYTARSIIASAQRCFNLYPEKNPEDAPAPYTEYPTPGLVTLGVPPIAGAGRGLYSASNGDLYAVIGPTVYFVAADWTFTKVGSVQALTTPVSFSDNGLSAVLVDSTTDGYQITLATRVMASIVDAAFFGANRADTLDTFLLFNKPGTPQFYTTTSEAVTPFDPLNFANKSGYPDPIVSIIVSRREIWLIGQVTTEVWFDAGNPDFPFQIMPGPFVQHGCAATYSVAQQGGSVFWLSRDLYGTAIAVMTENFDAKRISTHAIENEWSGYQTVTDAIGFCYQQEGHAFYVLTFPDADKTWCFDSSTGFWHERGWTDMNGVDHRHRAGCAAFAYGVNVVADWQTGTLYSLDRDAFTDAGAPIKRIRSFPHMMSDGRRVSYSRFVADIQVGTSEGTTGSRPPKPLLTAPGIFGVMLGNAGDALLGGPAVHGNAPQIGLRWSDTRGASWGNPLLQSMGATGQYLTQPQWRRLGMARDRVFELEWSVPVRTALNGAFVDVTEATT